MSWTIGTGPCGLAVFDDYIDLGARHATAEQKDIGVLRPIWEQSEMPAATNSSRYVYTREDALRIFYRIQLY
jgi:hypothetical protein